MRRVAVLALFIFTVPFRADASCTAQAFATFADATEQVVDYVAKGDGECGETQLQWRVVGPNGDPNAAWPQWPALAAFPPAGSPHSETAYSHGYPCGDEGLWRFQVRANCGALTGNGSCVRASAPSGVAEATFTIRWNSTLENLRLGPLYYSVNSSGYVHPLLFDTTYINGPRGASNFVREWLPTDRIAASAETNVNVVGTSYWQGTSEAVIANWVLPRKSDRFIGTSRSLSSR